MAATSDALVHTHGHSSINSLRDGVALGRGTFSGTLAAPAGRSNVVWVHRTLAQPFQSAVTKVPSWRSCKAWAISARVFITKGP